MASNYTIFTKVKWKWFWTCNYLLDFCFGQIYRHEIAILPQTSFMLLGGFHMHPQCLLMLLRACCMPSEAEDLLSRHGSSQLAAMAMGMHPSYVQWLLSSVTNWSFLALSNFVVMLKAEPKELWWFGANYTDMRCSLTRGGLVQASKGPGMSQRLAQFNLTFFYPWSPGPLATNFDTSPQAKTHLLNG